MILAIDTSTNTISLALFDGSLDAEHTWVVDQHHTRRLLPELRHMLSRARIEATQLEGIVVALGPGSFNGLRVGLSTAKSLCFALGISIAGIGTLEALAYQYAHLHLPIRPISDAGRGEFNTALYQNRDGKWIEVEKPWIAGIGEIRDRINEPTFVCGDIRKEAIAHMRHDLSQLISTPSNAGVSLRAGYLAELGLRKLQTGHADDLVSLQPIYLRRPAITKSKRSTAQVPDTQGDGGASHSGNQRQGTQAERSLLEGGHSACRM
ncbi:MAG: tRNA (adenosine(37)-N6)-threonylcarbamoyltransferase complex dimerization subunit type 1 TsaB [Chloroflexi bacterium]|nr:tRNA (adenosine(37)-N6)-threonylcarbamoyltransferase complex dimerization subunit type 1 TsaB [Chloroflexota bacterium]